MRRRLSPLAAAAIFLLGLQGSSSPALKIELRRDDAAGRLQVLIDGRETFVYQYAESIDLPHYWPMNSPRGKNMLVRQTEPYPHHRSFWFADTVRLNGGRPVSVYYALPTGRDLGTDPKTYAPPFNDHIRHLEFKKLEARDGRAVIETELRWEMDGRTPVLDERRTVLIHALGDGEYLLDLTFTLTASFGQVEFVSDDVHYAWPFLRLDKIWNGENGGKIITDTGGAGMLATNMKPARWLDYSNRVDGETAGVSIFQFPDGQEHRWLTREYGCVGPRRPDDRSGKPFALAKGETISQRVGVLVHTGDILGGRVAERYKNYIEGNWK
jgi:hypothetical protein